MSRCNRITCHVCNERKPKTGSLALAGREIFVCETCSATVRPYADAVAKAVVNAVRKSIITGEPLPTVEQLVRRIDRPLLSAAS